MMVALDLDDVSIEPLVFAHHLFVEANNHTHTLDCPDARHVDCVEKIECAALVQVALLGIRCVEQLDISYWQPSKSVCTPRLSSAFALRDAGIREHFVLRSLRA